MEVNGGEWEVPRDAGVAELGYGVGVSRVVRLGAGPASARAASVARDVVSRVAPDVSRALGGEGAAVAALNRKPNHAVDGPCHHRVPRCGDGDTRIAEMEGLGESPGLGGLLGEQKWWV